MGTHGHTWTTPTPRGGSPCFKRPTPRILASDVVIGSRTATFLFAASPLRLLILTHPRASLAYCAPNHEA
jgi:hypothetical protein